jgi:hypothetical protein
MLPVNQKNAFRHVLEELSKEVDRIALGQNSFPTL